MDELALRTTSDIPMWLSCPEDGPRGILGGRSPFATTECGDYLQLRLPQPFFDLSSADEAPLPGKFNPRLFPIGRSGEPVPQIIQRLGFRVDGQDRSPCFSVHPIGPNPVDAPVVPETWPICRSRHAWIVYVHVAADGKTAGGMPDKGDLRVQVWKVVQSIASQNHHVRSFRPMTVVDRRHIGA